MGLSHVQEAKLPASVRKFSKASSRQIYLDISLDEATTHLWHPMATPCPLP